MRAELIWEKSWDSQTDRRTPYRCLMHTAIDAACSVKWRKELLIFHRRSRWPASFLSHILGRPRFFNSPPAYKMILRKHPSRSAMLHLGMSQTHQCVQYKIRHPPQDSNCKRTKLHKGYGQSTRYRSFRRGGLRSLETDRFLWRPSPPGGARWSHASLLHTSTVTVELW